jgi:hypothetical protein
MLSIELLNRDVISPETQINAYKLVGRKLTLINVLLFLLISTSNAMGFSSVFLRILP